MIKRNVSLAVLLLMSLFVGVQAQTYDKMWKELEALEQKDLPQSVIAEAMKIYGKAKTERNAPQMMKAYLTAMQYRALLTPDSLKADRQGLERWAEEAGRVEDKAVLYSVLGELVMNEDVKLGLAYLHRSLEGRDRLLKLSAAQWKPMTQTGETSRRYFRDNLYDLLARRAIRLMKENRWAAASKGNQTDELPAGVGNLSDLMTQEMVPASDCDVKAAVVQVYQSLLKAYDTEADRSAWLLTAIDALDYVYLTFRSDRFTAEKCRQELQTWGYRYAAAPAVPEVFVALATYFRYENKQADALRVVREALAKYPRYEGINRLKNIEKEILQPSLSLRIDPAYPERRQDLYVSYRNLKGLTLQLYKVDLPITSAALQIQAKDFERKHARLQREEHYALKPTDDCLQTDTTLNIQAPPPGIYYLKALPDGWQGSSAGVLMYVTSLRVIHRILPDKTLELVAVDSHSGQPVAGAEVVTYLPKAGGYQPEHTWQADKDGTLRMEHLSGKRVYYHVRMPGDEAMPVAMLWENGTRTFEDSGTKETLHLFTDRSMYRPGQTVYFSGLAYRVEKDVSDVLPDKKYTVSLYDVNHHEIGKTEVVTNGFGSFSGQFALPSSCLTGWFQLKVGGATAGIQVEEYKRPAFEVVFDPVKDEYRVGDSIRLAGVAKTFAGAPVTNAGVRYRVTRQAAWFWRFNGNRTAAWEGETVTDADGRFQVPARLEVDADAKALSGWYYTYTVAVEVTDGTGETQREELMLPLGSSSIRLDISGLSGRMVKERAANLTLSAFNLSGEPVDAEITYRVVELEEQPDNRMEKKEGREVWRATALANRSFVPTALCALPSGSYRLKLSATDAHGRECREEEDFVLFSLADRRPPIPTADWFYQDGDAFDEANPPSLYIGSSEKDVYLLYDVFAGNRRLESRRIALSDSIVCFSYPYREVYGDGIRVSMAFVKKGQLYAHEALFVRPQPDKRLQLKWTAFRDKLRPGGREEWKLTVLRPDGSPADAELLATMYDASLDKLSHGRHHLPFRLYFQRLMPYSCWFGMDGGRSAYGAVDFPLERLKCPSWAYSRLLIPRVMAMRDAMPKLLARSLGGVKTFKSSAMAVEVNAMADVAFEEEIVPAVAQMDNGGQGSVEVRQNFAETAFFYPHLRTDANGVASLSFVLPESLTRWRFLALAHTRDVDYGTIEAEAVAAKEFMLQPNMPRFVRVGDRTHVAASLVNLSDKAVEGTVRMELFNPETERVFSVQKQNFSVKPGETTTVDFAFEVNEKHTLLACRLVADGDTFSDGEQRYIPVLTNKQWVTESLPLNVKGGGKHTFSLEKLFNHHSTTASGQRLTVEFTANPAWYAVQALPVVADPRSEDALSWAVAYYAHSLAAHIVKANPRIKQVFDAWKAQGGNKETFMSHLQKNRELKELLLEETPWLAEAADECEQRQRLATLFDLNAMTGKRAVALDRLEALQQADGAWGWYKGMDGNRYVTTQVMEMLVRLNALTQQEADNRMQRMFQKGLDYLAGLAAKEYKQMKEAEKKGATGLLPSEQAVRYLYVCALRGKLPADRQVNRYLMDKLSANGMALTIYGKALGAVVLQRAGREAEAQQFMQSLMEYSVATEEMGRYFDTPKAYYSCFSYKIPTEVAAMEAIQAVTRDATAMDEMKHWLLKQKQTQVWETPLATVDAVYALLMTTGTADLLADVGEVSISLGTQTLHTSADHASGYLKQTLADGVMNIRTVTVRKSSDVPGWGAVYAGYLENMDKVDGQGNALAIRRELYRGEEALADDASLKMGDKITVRLTVTADRDMDFIQIKDERAACMEPLQQLSGYRGNNGLFYYQATKDASTSFFVDRMRKGTYVIEYQTYVNRRGDYQAGIATAQSAYAPEFVGHTAGYRLTVE